MANAFGIQSGRRPRLSSEFVRRLVARAQAGDAVAREEVLRNLSGLIISRAKHFRSPLLYNGAADLEDLVQAGYAAATVAIEEWDSTRGTSFPGFVRTVVDRGLSRDLQNSVGLKHPEHLNAKRIPLRNAVEQIRAKGQAVTVDRLMAATGFKRTTVLALVDKHQIVESLDAAIAASADGREPKTLNDVLGDIDPELDLIELGLTPTEQTLIRLRMAGMTRVEIAEQTDFTEAVLRGIERRLRAVVRPSATTQIAAGAEDGSAAPPPIDVAGVLTRAQAEPSPLGSFDPDAVRTAFYAAPPKTQVQLASWASAYVAKSEAMPELDATLAKNQTRDSAIRKCLRSVQSECEPAVWPVGGHFHTVMPLVAPTVAAAHARTHDVIESLPASEAELLRPIYLEGASPTDVLRTNGLRRPEQIATLHRAEERLRDLRAQLPVAQVSASASWSPDELRAAFDAMDLASQARLGTFAVLARDHGPAVASRACSELFDATLPSTQGEIHSFGPLRAYFNRLPSTEPVTESLIRQSSAGVLEPLASFHELRCRLISTFPEAQRDLLESVLLDGRSFRECASVVGVVEKTYAKRFRQPFNQLRRLEVAQLTAKRSAQIKAPALSTPSLAA